VASEDRLALRIVNLFRAFNKTRWFRVTYIILLGLVVALMYFLASSALTCLVVILMPLIVFLFPYFFGERKVRRFAVNALPVFLIAILVATAISTQILLSENQAIPRQSFPGVASSETMALSNGTVAPYHADPSANFTFRVKLTTTVNATPDNYTVWLNLTIISGISFVNQPPVQMIPCPGNATKNPRTGTCYETQLKLTDAIYVYGFSVSDNRTNPTNWTVSNVDFGPLTAPWGAFYGLILYFTGTSMLLPLVFYYLILFLWWYTARSRELRTRQLGKTLEIPKEKPESKDEPPGKPKPEPAEKAAKAAAYTCTNCGADVGEDEEKCPKCGAVFEA
jgi:hypothetical protein